MTNSTAPANLPALLPQLLKEIPYDVLSTFRMEGGGDGGQGGSGGGQGGDGGQGGGSGSGGGQGSGGGGGNNNGGGGGRTFTQDDVDRIVQERLARASGRVPDDYADLQAKARKLEELEEQSRSDQEKAVNKARKEGADEARNQEREQSHKRIVSAEVRAAASGKLRQASDALQFIDLTQFTVNDDGEVDRKAIDAAIDKLLEEKDYLAGETGSPDNGGQGGNGSRGNFPGGGQGQRGSGGSQRPTVKSGRERYAERHGKNKSTTT